MQPADFFSQLWPGGVPEGTRFTIWTLQTKRSEFFDDLDAAAAYALDQQIDTYLGGALAPIGLRRNQRVKLTNAQGIPGLWIDLDYDDPTAHKKDNLPSRDRVDEWLAGLPDEDRPTVVIHSGHGYQAWWLFQEPWLTPTDEDRAEAYQVLQAWNYYVRDQWRALGFDVDSTFDLSRVMRCPGTDNHKAEPVPVTVASSDGPRHARELWISRMAEALALPQQAEPGELPKGTKTSKKPAEGAEGGALTLDRNAEPPAMKFMALCEADPKVALTFQHARRDYADKSPSSYDQGLANYFVNAGWSDQEITNALIASRRMAGDDLKMRQDYYRRTIDRARADVGVVQIEEDLEHAQDPLAELSIMFGIEIAKLIKYEGDPSVYVLVLNTKTGENKRITLGGSDAILNQRTFRTKVADAANHVIPGVKGPKWDKRAQALLNALTVEDMGDDATPAGQARGWIEEYVDQRKPTNDVNGAALEGKPFYDEEGRLCLSMRPFSQYIRTVLQERQISTKELGRFMRMAGYARYHQSVTEDSGTSTRNYWRAPERAG